MLTHLTILNKRNIVKYRNGNVTFLSLLTTYQKCGTCHGNSQRANEWTVIYTGVPV